MKPLCIDGFCGLGGWAEGFLAEGWDVIGFDIEQHVYGNQRYPAQLVLQDWLTLHGRQFRNAAAIVASPPCQAYSWMAMPWDLAKREGRWQKWERESPFGNFRLNDLFDSCFRIQREASEAAGHPIPMVVENVKGAQPWVGAAKAHFGSFYLWGDVESVGGRIVAGVPRFGDTLKATRNGQKVDGFNFHQYEKTGQPGGSFQTAAVNARSGTKQGGDWFSGYGGGFGWDHSQMRIHNSKSPARKAASAMIAKIPFELASHIARVLKPF